MVREIKQRDEKMRNAPTQATNMYKAKNGFELSVLMDYSKMQLP